MAERVLRITLPTMELNAQQEEEDGWPGGMEAFSAVRQRQEASLQALMGCADA